MSFNFVNLACVQNYINPEILIHGVFPLRTCGKKLTKHGSVQNGILHARLSRLMSCHDWRSVKGTIQCCIDRYAIVVLKDDTIVGHIPKKISRIL